jgi:hypothetical protein
VLPFGAAIPDGSLWGRDAADGSEMKRSFFL